MNKTKLDRFIQKYSLNGNVNSVKWTSKDDTLSTSFVTTDKSLMGNVKVDNVQFEDGDVGIFTTEYTFRTQLIGVVSYGVVSFICAFIIFYTLNLVMKIRVSEEEELKGLDIGEHDMESYAGFQIFTVE